MAVGERVRPRAPMAAGERIRPRAPMVTGEGVYLRAPMAAGEGVRLAVGKWCERFRTHFPPRLAQPSTRHHGARPVLNSTTPAFP